jgi:hypothetical protein
MSAAPHSTPLRKIALFGVVVWLVPFVISFGLYTPDGQPRFSEDLFESVMAVSLTGITAAMAYRLFKPTQSIGPSGFVVGLVWAVISIVLDIPTIVMGLGMAPSQYVVDVALTYLVIPAVTIAVAKTARARRSG